MPDASYTVPTSHWIEAGKVILDSYEKGAPTGT
jgi:hypothetical protein